LFNKRQPNLVTRRRRYHQLGVIVALVALLIGSVAVPAIAVHDLEFQLDGNIADDAAAADFDWTSFFNGAGTASPALPDASRPGFTDSGFKKDFTRTNGVFDTADTSTYATGSKDTLPISTGWQCNIDHNVNSKIDIANAYAVAYTDPSTQDRILYFGLERYDNSGDANVGFWFLKDGSVDCSSTKGSVSFTGHHVNGDVLVVSAFTKGGLVSVVTAYEWLGDDATGGLNPTPVATGVDCRDPLLVSPDATCATVNIETLTGVPWDTANKGALNTLPVAEFFEGGINLTTAGLGTGCFNTFVGVTRSSQALTATLFDYARGSLGECGVALTTAPSSTANRTLGSTTAITDTATVVGTNSNGGTGPTPTGTVTFFLCGPADLVAGVCPDNGGTSVATASPLAETTPGTATATSADAQSLLTTVGKYCFRAHYAAAANDPNYVGQTAETGNKAAECFTVTSVATTTTAQKWLPQDKATVTASGGATVAGTVTFTLYDGSATCTTGTGVTTTTFGPMTLAADGTATTNNTTYYTTSKTISWRAVFTSSNGVGSGDPATCESSSLTITN
jgi:hypothetical protein